MRNPNINKRPHRASLAAHHMPGKADRQRILIEKQKEEGFLFKKIDPKNNSPGRKYFSISISICENIVQ